MGDSLGGSRNNPIVFEEESDTSQSDVKYRCHRSESAEPDGDLFSGKETTHDSRTSVSSSLEACRDVERQDSTETA